MIRATAVFVLAVWVLPAQTAKPVVLSKQVAGPAKTVRIAPQTFRDLERRFDGRLEGLVPDVNEPADLLGETRGIYVDGYGVVFTAVVSLVKTPELSPFLKEIPKDRAEHIRKLRLDRLPILKAAMHEMLNAMAMTFMQIPSDQKMVLVVRLYYPTWESTVGMPAEVRLTATRAGVQTGEIQEDVQ